MSDTIQALLRRLRGAADPAGERTDADLLDLFARRGDAAAFRELVARHGPMVLGVCRRLLSDPHDAEDAFQATFLVLAKKATALGRGDSVGAWLHGVACRVAAHSRADRARRRAHERRATAMSAAAEPTPAALWEDLKPVLDEEVRRLSDKYRVPVVLCYLGGKTYDEAAREIGCPKGTVATRLARARELLRERLSGRGITLPAAGLAVVLGGNSQAAVPASLLAATVEAATSSAAPAAVATLTEAALKAVSASKLKAVTALIVALGLLTAGVGAFAYRAAGDVHPTAVDRAGDPPAPEKARPGGAEEFPWGEPDAGVQVRLRPRQARWKVGEAPAFAVDVRNQAKQPMSLFPSAGAWEVELDGTWYGRKLELYPGTVEETPRGHPRDRARLFRPGEEVKDWVTLPLDGKWLRGVRGEKRIRSDQAEEALPLAPGRHRVRVAYHIHTGFCPVSNVLEIEVMKADDKEDPGPAPGVAGPPDPLATLRGTWEVTAEVVDGRPVEVKGVAPGDRAVLKWVVADRKVTIRIGPLDGSGFAIEAVDSAATPGRLDLRATGAGSVSLSVEGKRFPAIYEITGDTLRVCYALDGPRPDRFTAEKGSGRKLLTLRRADVRN